MAICLPERIAELEAKTLELEAAIAQLRVTNAELSARNAELVAENAGLAAEKARVERERDTIRDCYQQALLTIKRLERGLLGPKTEKLPNDSQLTMDILSLVKAGQARDTENADSSEGAAEAKPEDDQSSGDPPRKNRPTGRKPKPRNLPRLEIEILPPEVLQEGLDAFERIGEESCEVTERRQGGSVVVVFKRPKFKRKKERKTAQRVDDVGGASARMSETAETALPASAQAPVEGAPEAGLSLEQGEPMADDGPPEEISRLPELEFEERAPPGPGSEGSNPEPEDGGGGGAEDPSPSGCKAPREKAGSADPPDDEDGGTILVAPPPELPIERGSAGPGLLAETIVRRWLYATPLNRMAKMFAREGLPVAKSTICSWHQALGDLVRPLVEAMHRDALTQPVLCTDATGVQVQAKGQCVLGHFFVLIAPGLHVLFFYTKRHDGRAVDLILAGFRGALVADAHSVYDHLYAFGDVIEAGCWSHARRYFHKALSTDPERAKFALGRIAALFKIEKEIAGRTPSERLEARRKRSKPIVDAFFAWCEEQALSVIDDTPIQRGIRYALNQREALQRFLEDERLPIHNNWSESQLRREAIGRKNWGFLGTHDAGDTNARFMSLLASAELHGLEPYAYIRDLLCLLPNWPASRVLELAPAYWEQTLEETDAQKRLDDNVFRGVSMGLDPLPAPHMPRD